MNTNYGSLFNSLFNPVTKKERVLSKTGQVSGILLGISAIFISVFQNWEGLGLKIFVGIFLVGVILFFSCFTLLAIIQVGKQSGRTTFLSQAFLFYKRLFLFLFLPSIIILLVILAWAYFTHQPMFR